jgi:hypothetical protein
MTLIFTEPEQQLTSGANWAALEYLIWRFNHRNLDGTVILERTALFENLQLRFSGVSCSQELTMISESFFDDLITSPFQQRELIETVSRFLLKLKGTHLERCREAEQ